MKWIDTTRVVTAMIQQQIIRNLTDRKIVGHAISKHVVLNAGQPERGTAVLFKGRSLPGPTARTGLNLRPKAMNVGR